MFDIITLLLLLGCPQTATSAKMLDFHSVTNEKFDSGIEI